MLARTMRFGVRAMMVIGGAVIVPMVAWAADMTAPPVPGNFQATVVRADAKVTLSWSAASDASGIKGYRLDRSIDQSNWTMLSRTITALSYQDTTTTFGIHYFYRLQAIDGAGNASGWAMADVLTDEIGAG